MNKEEIIAFIRANLKMLHQAESPEDVAQWIKDNPSADERIIIIPSNQIY